MVCFYEWKATKLFLNRLEIKVLIMKNLLLGLVFAMGTFWVSAQSIAPQTNSPQTKSFVAFGVSGQHTYELKQLETILNNNPDYEMVRVDYSRNTVFIVSAAGVELTDDSLREISGANYAIIRCAQYGVYGVDDSQSLPYVASNNLISQSWMSFEIPLSQQTGLNSRSQLAQIIFLGGDNSTLYVDNIYFHN